MSNTPRMGLPLIEAAQAQKHVTHNEALVVMDALAHLYCLDRDLAAPPLSPVDGDAYLVASGASGGWVGQDGKIAYLIDAAWRFYAPFKGLRALIADEPALIHFDGAAWIDVSSLLSLQNVPLLGVGTTADATNPFSAKLNNALFTAKTVAESGDGDLRIKANKEAVGDTVSYLFQTGFSGRAEFGLVGNDDFTIKVSSDGSTWVDALTIDKATGEVTFSSLNAATLAASGAVMDNDFAAADGFMRKTGAGAYEAIKSNLAAAVAPGATDDSAAGYAVGSRWIDTTGDKEYVCLDATATAAVWTETTAGAGGGEANTASNIGVAGVGVFKQKTGVNLEFKKLNAGSAKVTVTDDTVNNEIDIDVPDASATAKGAVELATIAEVDTGTDTVRAITPAGLAGSVLGIKVGQLSVTQPVDLDAIETRVNALDASVILMGTWDASVGTFPGGGTAQAGESWIVSVGGTVGGVVFTANDRIVAILDNASTTVFAANWHQLDYTDQVLSVAGKTGAVSLVKADVGLGNVDNTADTAKPVSTAQQTALDAKAPLASPALTGTPTAPTAAAGDNSTKVATTAFVLANAEPLGELAGINSQTGVTYTLVIGDKGKAVEMSNAAANTLTVPPNTSVVFPVKTRIDLVQMGAGQTTIAAGAGVTIRSNGAKLKLTGQYATATLYKRGTDEWVLGGNLSV